MTGTKDEVLARVAEQAKSDSYRDPTETLPQQLPSPCDMKHTTDENCSKCETLNKWWDNFPYIVDDLISKSNIHNCERGINKDGSTSKKYASCKDNRYGKCKACFPWATFTCTEVDPESGSINVKKLEPWINFITPLVTYIMHCNTDVTCMWSGTALKAVIMYVSDYITKTGLKTHVMFEAIRNIFDKHHKILSSSLSDREKARQLMNKIVNALSVKAEMGGPMVCMYLLGNPDHYTNHTFVPFYWYSFIAEAQKAWEQVDSNHVEKVTLVRTKRHIVGFSPVYDYIYRPSYLDDMSIYDWVLQCKRQKYNMNQHKKKVEKKAASDDSDPEDVDNEYSDLDKSNDSESEYSFHDQKTEDTIIDDAIPKTLPGNMYRFKSKHPLYDTHVTILQKQKANAAVNFIGCNLPRCDQGDREFYCLTMLALFKPWRSGLDLKNDKISWDDAFTDYDFTKQQQQLMRNFNIKYECLDARDDFRAKMIAGSAPNDWSIHNSDIDGNGADSYHDEDNDPCIELTVCDIPEPDTKAMSRSEIKRQREAGEIRDVLQRVGWLDQSPVVHTLDVEHFVPQNSLSAATWKSVLQAKKLDTIENKAFNHQSEITNLQSFTPNVVKVVDQSYLEKKYHTTEHNKLIDGISHDYCLNEEQE